MSSDCHDGTSFLDGLLEQGSWFAHLRTLLGAFPMLMRRLEGSWQQEHLFCTVPSCNVCFPLKCAQLSWVRWGTCLQSKNGLRETCWRSSSLWGVDWGNYSMDFWLRVEWGVRGGQIDQTWLLCALLELCIPGNQARGRFVLFKGRSKLSMFSGYDLMYVYVMQYLNQAM